MDAIVQEVPPIGGEVSAWYDPFAEKKGFCNHFFNAFVEAGGSEDHLVEAPA